MTKATIVGLNEADQEKKMRKSIIFYPFLCETQTIKYTNYFRYTYTIEACMGSDSTRITMVEHFLIDTHKHISYMISALPH